MRIKKLFNNPLFNVVTGSFLATILATPIVAIMNSVKWTEAIGIIFSWLWNVILAVLNFEVKLWWLLVRIALFVVIILIWEALGSKESIIPTQYIFSTMTLTLLVK